MLVPVSIAIMISIVIGVALIPFVVDAIEAAQKKPTGHIPAKKKERVREPAQHASVLGMAFDSLVKRVRRRDK